MLPNTPGQPNLPAATFDYTDAYTTLNLQAGIEKDNWKVTGYVENLFDDNSVTIDGSTDLSDNTDQCKRFEAAGWATKKIDGHNTEEIYKALEWAQKQDKPVMVACKTIIGYGAPTLAGTGKAHGGPYGADEVAGIRKNIGWDHPPFEIPADIEHAWKREGAHAAPLHAEWKKRHSASPKKADFDKALAGELGDIEAVVRAHKKAVVEGGESKATRQWSGAVLEELTRAVPEMVGGSADLTGSNNTKTKATEPMTPANWGGRYIHYGVREHGMAAAMNGMSLHKGVIPYSGTFLVFADYSRAAIRLGALMGAQVVHVMTHDSIGLGEDGPTHQPVEQVASLRAMPNMLVFRPADGVETAECWELALKNQTGPSTIALTRQGVASVRTEHVEENLSARGGYVLSPAKGEEKVVLIATGSEVGIAVEAQAALEAKGIGARVVSMPCMELFEAQDAAYQSRTLGGELPKVAVEAGVRFGWDRWIGHDGGFVGMNSFGASAPYKDLYKKFGITADGVVAAAEALV